MFLINATNVNDAYHEALWAMKTIGYTEQSRNGPVRVANAPVCTRYTRPWERVLFNQTRRANPFFHLAEAMWMLAGRDDVEFIEQFNSQMRAYADFGELKGAYGYRWRSHWEDDNGYYIDQIPVVAEMLRKDPTTRRAVITMWDPYMDLATDNSDIPCNTQLYFRVVEGRLDMTSLCRSNDIIWGAYGANAVHLSILHELISAGAGIPQGTWYQFSNNWHIYERHWPLIEVPQWEGNPYEFHDYTPIVRHNENWRDVLADAEQLMLVHEHIKEASFSTYLFDSVVRPMVLSWQHHKAKRHAQAEQVLWEAPTCDWTAAGIEWLKGVSHGS